jgi:PPOX class probable F420-dependent enzyme
MPPRTAAEPTAYQARVPAVARAVAALEQLADAQQPLTLSALSRSVGVGPSSMLAILTTLRAAGLVSRSTRDGRYLPGPGLVALGTAAAQRLEPLNTFDVLAAELVERTGETVLLWIQHGDGLAMAAAREGSQPLRYIPPLGLRLPAGGWAARGDDGLVGGELEPGVWMLGASLDERALLAVVGPSARLRGPAGSAARAALRTVAGDDARWTGAGPIEPHELDAFLAQALVASLSYLSADGYPASVALWYDWDGTAFWLVPSPQAEWAGHVRRNPRVSLAVSESEPPLRRVLARGPLEVVDDPDASRWRSVEGRLAARYARLDAARLLEGRSDQPRVLLRLEPERLIAWRGLLRPADRVVGPATTDEVPARLGPSPLPRATSDPSTELERGARSARRA